MSTFEDLDVWKRSGRLSFQIYKELNTLIKEISAMLVGLINTIKLKTEN